MFQDFGHAWPLKPFRTPHGVVETEGVVLMVVTWQNEMRDGETWHREEEENRRCVKLGATSSHRIASNKCITTIK